jgi:protein-tyrosine phosphatase
MGNICRSPAAEGIAKSIINKNGLANLIEIDSAGTIDYHTGEPPDPRMIAHSAKRGYNLNSLARHFNPDKDFEYFDYIVTMDDENYKNIISLDTENKFRNKVFKMTSFGNNRDFKEVPDPYYSGSKGFEIVLDILENSINDFVNKIDDDIKKEDRKSN